MVHDANQVVARFLALFSVAWAVIGTQAEFARVFASLGLDASLAQLGASCLVTSSAVIALQQMCRASPGSFCTVVATALSVNVLLTVQVVARGDLLPVPATFLAICVGGSIQFAEDGTPHTHSA